MHADIIPPKYHPLRPNRNIYRIPRVTRTYMPHADAAAWTSANGQQAEDTPSLR